MKTGLLGGPDWDSLTAEHKERLLYLQNPEYAYQRIKFLEEYNAGLERLNNSYSSTVLNLLDAMSGPQARAKEKALRTEKKRIARLDSKAGSLANMARANDFAVNLLILVRSRLKDDGDLTIKALAYEAYEADWNRKNKAGGKYSLEYIKDKIGPLRKRAKAELKALKK